MKSKNKLKALLTKGVFLAIYSNAQEPARFNVGFVLACNESEFIIHSLDENGVDDGLYVGKLDDIIKVELESSYLKKILFLKENFQGGADNSEMKDVLNVTSGLEVLVYACKERVIISVWLEYSEDAIMGFVQEVADGILILQLIDACGVMDEKIAVNIESVVAMQISAHAQRHLQKLVQNTLEC
ncbi:MAG: hypothetical protein LBV12_00075 [Puniceicoccales bacterium]|jgi:hypothetical protein|nr:hypothetical protein [Puniceicoccales bacterium]